MSPVRSDEFFIGWLPVPRGYVRVLIPVALLLVLLGAGIAGLLAALQRDPGTGQWEDGEVVTLDGVVLARPYAMLHVSGNRARTYLLVEEGKFGALERVEKLLDGASTGLMRATGTVLHRDGRWMLELAEGDRGMHLLSTNAPPPLPEPRVVSGRITLIGEIIDPKCYLGAMKPGGGKTHKGCASLCIAGGIPPMLVTRDAHRNETFYLLTTSRGDPANEVVMPFVGDVVEITGRLESHGDLLVLALSAVRRR